ncbi:MAG: zinc-binding dehydrogenase [Phycisphaeraceae bacterium]|nr:zinc-binding dehydrogenase [Phycisphaeraceae bacterium]
MKTKALVFSKVDTYEVCELTLPDPNPDDIVVKTLVTAISPGTERWILRGKHMGTQFPCVPGYHRIGVVEQCGKQVSQFQVGDIVYGCQGRWDEPIHSMWGAHVGHSVGHWTGYDFIDSSMPNAAELENLSFMVLTEVANRGIRFLDPKPNQTLAIIGCGIIGICAAQLAMLRGVTPILLDINPDSIALAKTLLPHVFSSNDSALEEKIAAIAPGGLDYLYDSVGHAPTTDAMVQQLKRQGMLLLQAQYFDKEKCALDLDQIKLKEVTVKTTCGTDSQDRLDTMTNIRQRRLKIGPLITHRFKADQILKGYDLLHTGKPFSLGITFDW